MAHAGLVLCEQQTQEEEVQRGRAHLHSVVILQETKCSQTLSHDSVTHSRVHYIQNAQKREGVEEMAVREWYQLRTRFM